jgi:membrane protein implicated in regulation of membrane protease activity
MTIGLFYVSLLIIGFLYSVISLLAGWISDVGGNLEIGGHADIPGHADTGHLGPISGTTVATFVTGFGGGGVVAHYWLRWPLLGSLSVAIGSGVVVAAAAYAILDFIFKETQAGSEFAVAETVGREAEVIVAIPAGGVGEVAYIMRGQREQSSARSVDGASIPRGSAVVIDRVSGPTAYVRRKDGAAASAASKSS